MRQKHNIETILEAGQDLFRRQGYHNTGVDEVLKAANMPKGSFYNFFKNKEDFGAQVLRYYSQNGQKDLKKQLSKPGLSPLERLKAMYQGNIAFHSKEQCRYGCLLNNFSLELGGLSDEMMRVMGAEFEQYTSHLAACIAEGQADGSISKALPAQDLADYLHNNWNGAVVRMKATRSTAPLKLFMQTAFIPLEPSP